MFLCRVFFGAEAAAPPRWQGNVPDRGHLQEHIYRNTAAPKNTEKKMNLSTKTKLWLCVTMKICEQVLFL